MKAEFLVENIENFLPALSKILPLHSQIPVLSNILIEAAEDGFFVSATNLEIGIRIKIPAKIETRGAITVPGKQFIEVISTLPKDKVLVYLEKNNFIIESRGNKVSFQTIARDEFPTLFEKKGEELYVFKNKELRDIFSRLVFAVSLDEGRPELTGVLLSQKDEKIDFVATDGFRLSLKRIVGKDILKGKKSLIVPAKIINDALALKNDDISMSVYEESNQIVFETENVVLIGRIINGEFPNYERVIPASSKTKITLDRQVFEQNLRFSSVFARESANIVKFKVEEDKVKIYAKSAGLGEGEAVIEAEREGEDNEIAFNVKFVMDLLKNIDSQNVLIELSSALEPAVFKTEDDQDFLHIIMPVRLQE